MGSIKDDKVDTLNIHMIKDDVHCIGIYYIDHRGDAWFLDEGRDTNTIDEPTAKLIHSGKEIRQIFNFGGDIGLLCVDNNIIRVTKI